MTVVSIPVPLPADKGMPVPRYAPMTPQSTLEARQDSLSQVRGKLRDFAFVPECRRLSSGGLLPDHDLLVVVADPKQPGSPRGGRPSQGVGSGGATINAVLVAVERLSAQLKHTTINSELVHHSRILVVHTGRMLAHCPGGAALLRINPQLTFVPPHAQITPPTLLQHTLWAATKLSEKIAHGVWVTSLDTFLPHTPGIACPIPPPESGVGALVCTVHTPLDLATQHGVVLSKEGNIVNNMVYRMPLEDLKKTFRAGSASVISGSVYLSPSLTETLLGLHMLPPLDRCTYYGLDSGVPALQVSLYFDLLLPLCCDVSHEEYVSGQCGATYAQAASYSTLFQQESRSARLQIWKQLQGFKALVWPLGEVKHHYLGMNLSFADSLLSLLPSSSIVYQEKSKADKKNIVTVNTILEGNITTSGDKTYIFDSWFGRDVSLSLIGPCILNGLQLRGCVASLKLPGGCVWQQFTWTCHDVVTCHGWTDCIAQPRAEPTATVFNTSWSVFLSKTRIVEEDLWENPCEVQNLLSAKIFLPELPIAEQISIISALVGAACVDNQHEDWRSKMQKWRSCTRVSLSEAMFNCDVKKVIQTQEVVFLESFKQYLVKNADDLGGMSYVPLFQYFVKRGLGPVKEVLQVLHTLLHTPRPSTSRLFSNVADLLGCLAQGRGGLRSGPAGNPLWKTALVQLKSRQLIEAVQQMEGVCEDWINSGRPENLIRAARHYERASQIVISQQVETAEVHVTPMWVCPAVRRGLGVGVWVEAHSPARLDLAGGWTDTPPICYEQGGAVLNIAIKINNKKPIGARARFIPELQVVCVLRDCSGGDVRLTWTELDHLRDYDNPVSPGALVKAVLLYSRLLDLTHPDSLAAQLNDKYGGGVEVEVWSNLPQGSGLGGSSLLAGTLLAALVVLLGHPPPAPSQLVHATLCVEQWLTTGGGWQDQVGGLIGGAKLGVSHKGMPLSVTTYQIPLSQQCLEALNGQLLLIYTGKVRLARNLLQTVIRNWYARDPTVTQCFSELRHLALQAAGAMLDGKLEGLGTCINNYWKLKKMVASGCEPSMRLGEVLSAGLRSRTPQSPFLSRTQ
ncbi:L-fucose kinase [Chionoecetes opilio]|uniref:L-fucose kinase n=1 Tax=Chionoecetes opilio TaxID=41210 RepID=A0A8J5CWE6_CHIOP|nr:L-fucose kinase [Chionoecetes opilio]